MMAIIGFIVMLIFLVWLTFFSVAVTLGTFFLTGQLKGESLFGVLIFVCAMFGWVSLFENSPFKVVLV